VATRAPAPRFPQTTAVFLPYLDRDGDGLVQREEYGQASRNVTGFDDFDLDRDGRLTSSEVDVMLACLNPDYGRQNLVGDGS